MTEKTLRSIITALVVLVALWGLSLGIGALRKGSGGAAESGVAAALGGMESAGVTGVSISGPGGESITLAREGADWTANDYPADSIALSRLWEALDGAEVGDVVATNPANHARMGVSSDSTWRLELRSAAGSAALLIGKTGRAYNSAYVRLPEEDEVVLAFGDLRSSVTRRENDWKDKTIVSVDTARVARVVVERQGETAALVRGDSAWTVNGDPAKSSSITNLLRELHRLVANGFKADSDTVFTGNERQLRVEDGEGALLAEVRFLGDGTTQHALVPNGTVTFEIPNWRVDRVAPTAAVARETPDDGS